ncbi:hypothetical protein ACSBR1_003519 [Camellia fascicularis]
MVPPLMLLCKYGDHTIVFKVVSNCTLKDLTNFLSCKLKKFNNSGCILLLYCLPGHLQCMIDDDSDFQNMLSLVYPLGVDRVDVTITEMGISNEKQGVGESWDATGSNTTDDEMDLLPVFCQHEERILLSCGWVNGITHVGQRFIGGAKDFRTALCKYAIEIGFEFVYVKNEKCRVTALCSMRESKACLWRVHASLESANNFFYIRTLHDEHTCGAAVRTSKNSRMSSNLVASLIVNEVRGNPQTRPIDVVRQFTDQYGLTITYNHAWLGVKKARTTIFGDFSMSYDEIRWYMDIVMSTNPGIAVLYCLSMELFLKGKYKGTLLTATAKDRDQGFSLLQWQLSIRRLQTVGNGFLYICRIYCWMKDQLPSYLIGTLDFWRLYPRFYLLLTTIFVSNT